MVMATHVVHRLLLALFCFAAWASDSNGNLNNNHNNNNIDCNQHIVWKGREKLSVGKPPHDMPANMIPAFTRCGSIPNATFYIDDTYDGNGSHYQYGRDYIKSLISVARKYRDKELNPQRKEERLLLKALRKIYNSIEEPGPALVVGSQEPWLEAWLLALGAPHVYTLEYNNLTYEHPRITTMKPQEVFAGDGELTSEFARKNIKFQVIVAVDCLDHDGLGRYGDPLAPDGDILSITNFKLLLSPHNSFLVLTLPVGPDRVVWNLQRVYGPIRLELLLRGWNVIRRLGWDESKLRPAEEPNWRKRYEPVFVLQPSTPTTHPLPETISKIEL